MLPILEFIEENVVGGDTRIVGPYGEKKGRWDILFSSFIWYCVMKISKSFDVIILESVHHLLSSNVFHFVCYEGSNLVLRILYHTITRTFSSFAKKPKRLTFIVFKFLQNVRILSTIMARGYTVTVISIEQMRCVWKVRKS